MFKTIISVRQEKLALHKQFIDQFRKEGKGHLIVFCKPRLTTTKMYTDTYTDNIGNLIDKNIKPIQQASFGLFMASDESTINIDSTNFRNIIFVALAYNDLNNIEQVITEYSLPEKLKGKPAVIFAELYAMFFEALKDSKIAFKRTIEAISGKYFVVIYNLQQNNLYIVSTGLPLYVQQEPIQISISNMNINNNMRAINAFNMVNISIKSLRILTDKSIASIPNKNTKILVPISNSFQSAITPFILAKMLGYNVHLFVPDMRDMEHMTARRLTHNISSMLSVEYTAETVRTFKINQINSTLHNLLLYLLMINFAEHNGISIIALSYLSNEWELYAQQVKAVFIDPINALYNNKYRFVVPTKNLDIKDVIELGTALGAPFEAVITCQTPYKVTNLNRKKFKALVTAARRSDLSYIPCGVCESCLERKKLFYEARIIDPQANLYRENFNDDQIEQYKKIVLTNGYKTIDKRFIDNTIEYYKPKVNGDDIWVA